MPEKKRQKGYSVDCHDVAHVVEFCPYDWCSQLIAIGTATRVTVGTCRFPEDSPELDDLEWSVVKEFHHGSRITALAWSPDTSLVTMPKLVRFCTAAADKQLRLYSSDLKTENQSEVIGKHKDYINSVCFLKLPEPNQDWLVASASDDHTCRIWTLDGTEVACLPLGAPGMAVRWHHQEPGKLMVAEKKGVIRFYNAETQRPIMSLDCGHMPLVSADWCHGNPLQVAAAAGTDWFVFDTSRSSRPLENKQAHPEGCRAIGWCRSHDHILATTGSPAVQLKVFSIRTGHASLSTQMTISYGLSWHHRLPLVAVGGDKKVHFWAVEPL